MSEASQIKACYSVQAPGLLRSNAQYNVAINIFESQGPCTFRVKLSGGDFSIEKTVEVPPMTTKLLGFDIPEMQKNAEYYLESEGLAGVAFNERIQLKFAEGKALTYVELDKQAYKTNDEICLRTIFLSHLLKPADLEKTIDLHIKKEETIMKTISNLNIVDGIYTEKILIPKEWPSGNYKIEIRVGDELLASKDFQIIQYEQPKFEIKINAPNRIPYAEGQFNVGVEAKDPDGAPIKGICTMEVKSVAGYFTDPDIVLTAPFDGILENTIFDFASDLHIESDFVESEWHSDVSVMVKVTIKDEITGHEESLTKLVTVTRKEVDEVETATGKCCSSYDCERVMVSDEPMETDEPIKVILQTKDPKIGGKIDFQILINKPTKYCIYFITARGNIIKSQLIEISDCKEPIKCELPIDFQFMPRAFILAYYIHDGVLYSDEVGFDVNRQFENTIELIAPETTRPDETISLQLKTSPNSVVALMAVDEKSIVFNAKNQIPSETIFKDLFYIRSQTPKMQGLGRYPGISSGHVVITNSELNGFEKSTEDVDDMMWLFSDHEHMRIKPMGRYIDTDKEKNKILRENQERQQVFGNLLFTNNRTNENGLLHMNVELPSKTTTWLISAFVLSENHGFGILTEPRKILVKSEESEKIVEDHSKQKTRSRTINYSMDHYGDEIGIQEINLEKLGSDGNILELLFVIDRNLFGQTIADLEQHAGIMYCTGHLHMTTMIPNIDVLEYFEQLSQLDCDFAVQIKNRFPEAIARELSERRANDGGFGWFGHDEKASPHVTSLVLQAFQRAARYVTIDVSVIEEGLAFLARLQQDSGEFLKEVEPYKYPFEKDVGVGLTAMVLLSFLQTEEMKKKYAAVIEKGFEYIVSHIEPINCVYDLALSFYAMQLAKHPYAGKLKTRLNAIAKWDKSKDEKWWTYTLLSEEDPNTHHPISDLEVTSYILLGMLETESVAECLPIVKWLLPLKHLGNETMDCGVGLNAALKAAIKFQAPSGFINVDFVASSAEGQYKSSLQLSPQNSTKTLLYKLPVKTERLQFSTKDKGSFSGKIMCRVQEAK